MGSWKKRAGHNLEHLRNKTDPEGKLTGHLNFIHLPACAIELHSGTQRDHGRYNLATGTPGLRDQEFVRLLRILLVTWPNTSMYFSENEMVYQYFHHMVTNNEGNVCCPPLLALELVYHTAPVPWMPTRLLSPKRIDVTLWRAYLTSTNQPRSNFRKDQNLEAQLHQ